MQTPALRTFLNQIGKVVHHLNTVVVGLSAVEAGAAIKPSELDISWHPSNVVSSGRQARAFVMRATIVTVAEELGSYISDVVSSPACSGIALVNNLKRADRLDALREYFCLEEDHLFLGPLLLIHWRNKIIHRNSKAGLTKSQRDIFVAESSILISNYKNLDPTLLLQHFAESTPTLKDVSSLVAITINFAKNVEQCIPEPSSKEDVMSWIEHFGLKDELDRVERIAAAKGKSQQGITSFLMTHCPSIKEAYFQYVYRNS